MTRTAAFATLAMALAAPAAAMETRTNNGQLILGGAPRVEVVDISGFDLSTRRGVAGVHKRIVSTAYQLCDGALHGVSSDQFVYRLCIAVSVDQAVRSTGHHNLVTFHYALEPRDRSRLNKRIPRGWRPS
ncbi:MAG: UrcA family protein [Pseudomonadota bacterium]